MSRNRQRSPQAGGADFDGVVHALERIAEALRPAPVVEAAPPQVNQTMCRLLTLRHYGQWIEIPGRPSTREQHAEPSQLTIGGVLTGIRPGAPGQQGMPATRTLVIAQGPEQRAHTVRVDEPVNTYPRSIR